MLLPIGGGEGDGNSERKTLSGPEAASLARSAGCGIAVPHHFDQFISHRVSPEGFRQACTRLGQDCEILAPGERLSVERLPAAAAVA